MATFYFFSGVAAQLQQSRESYAICSPMRQLGATELGVSYHTWMEGSMRKVVGLVGATLLFAGPALAADLGKPAYKAPAPAYIASPWDGLYVGGNLGYGETSFEFPGISFHGNGVVGG